MKKLYALVLGAALLFAATDASAQLSIGVGYLGTTLAGTFNGVKQDNEFCNGIYMGAGLDLPLVEDALAVTPGLYLNVLSDRGVLAMNGATLQAKFTEVALNIPVYLSYGLEVGYSRLFVFAGPTFQCGITSRYKVDGSVVVPASWKVITEDGVIDNYSEFDYSRWNIYLGGGVGADLNETLRVTAGFDYGMLNLYKGDVPNTKYNRYLFKIGIGYLF